MGRMIRNSSSSSSKKKSSHPSSRTQKRSIIDHDHDDENEMTPQSWVDRLRLIPVVTEEANTMMIKEVEKEEKEEEEEGDVDVDTPFTTTTTTTTTPTTNTTKHTSLLHPTKTISILTWNVLAQAYCSRRSQVELPKEYNHVVFHKTKRKQRILQLLRQLTSITRTTNTNTTTNTTTAISSSSSASSGMDIVCLQEVDMNEIRPMMEQLGYRSVVETPRCVRANNTTMGGRIDGCSIYIRTAADHHLNIDEYGTSIVDSVATTVLDGTNDDNSNDDTTEDRPDDGDHHNHNNTVTSQNDNDAPDEVTSTISTPTSLPRSSISQTVQWKLIDSELIRLDDLATLSSFSASLSSSTTAVVETTTTSSTSNDATKTNGDNSASSSSHSHIQGIQQSLLRRNMAIMIRLQHTEYPEITMIVVNAHLFWNPSFEYVKVRDFVCTFMLYHVTCSLLRLLCVLLRFFQWSNLIIHLVLLYL